MKNSFKQLAIIGATASGKSDLAIEVAKKLDAYILSIDSLSVYKEIDIISAKPSKSELMEVVHFGIDVLGVNEHFSAEVFRKLYDEVVLKCVQDGKNLVIVGGTAFYLKSLIDGLSELPQISGDVEKEVALGMADLARCYSRLVQADAKYMKFISPNDTYRIHKAMLIFRASGVSPSEWFAQHPPKKMTQELPIFNIEVSRDVLRERIERRTAKMLEFGAIDEVCYLEQKYARTPNAMKSIGIVEILEYLDGKCSRDEMSANISLHTAQLAKRQQTFNRTQFTNVTSALLDEMEELLMHSLLENSESV